MSPRRPADHPIGRLAAASARRRRPVLLVAIIALILLGTGIPRLSFQDDLTDALPRGDPHTQAAERVVTDFPGAGYASPLFVSVAPEKWGAADALLPYRMPFEGAAQRNASADAAAGLSSIINQATAGNVEGFAAPVPGPNNITDEVYQRGLDELHLFLAERVPELRWGITTSSYTKLVNYTNTGLPGLRPPDPAAFSMPDTSASGARQFDQAWHTYWTANPDAVQAIVSSDWRTGRSIFLFEPGDQTLNEIGQAMYEAVGAYKRAIDDCDAGDECLLRWNVFRSEDVVLDPRGIPASHAYLSQVTLEDVALLSPFVAAFVGACLWLAFRRIGTVAALLLPLAFAGLGVLGTFGWVGIPITSVSLLVFPVLMGNGIDFGIHMATGYHNARLAGKQPEEAAYQAGRTAGTPLAIATATTVVGMLLLVFAPNTLLRQLGSAILLGMLILLAVSLTVLPAALVTTRSAPIQRAGIGAWLKRNARFWGRHRVAAVAILVALCAPAVLAATDLGTFILGTPATLYPEGDEQRADFDKTNQAYYFDDSDLVTNALALQGDLATPAAMDLLAALEERIRALDFVHAASVISIRYVMETWLQIQDGTVGAVPAIAVDSVRPGSNFPATEEEIEAVLDDMFASPLATYASLFLKEDGYDVGIVVVELVQPREFDDLEAVWRELKAAVDEVSASVPGHGVQIHPVSRTATAYLFVKEELPYVQAASFAGLAITGLLVLVIRRDLRDAATVAAVVLTAGLVWTGTLWWLDIQWSVALVVPVVMIAAIGSDYSLHLRYALRDEGDRAWLTVGRAVVYSAVTDIGAFLIFTGVRYGLVQEAAVATVSALACSLLATLLVVPVLDRRARTSQGDPAMRSSSGGPSASPGPAP